MATNDKLLQVTRLNNDQSHAILENYADGKRETINLLGVVLVKLSVAIKINTL